MPTPELVSLVARTLTAERRLLTVLDSVAEMSGRQVALLAAGRLGAYRALFAPKLEAIESAQEIDRSLAPLRDQCRQAVEMPLAARDELACLAERQIIALNRISTTERELALRQLDRFATPASAREEVVIT